MPNISQDLIEGFRDLLLRYKSVRIVIPTPPDIDAVCSAIVLANFLQSKSIQVTIISQQTLPDYYRSIVGDWTVGQSIDNTTDNLIFIIDCPTIRNTGFAEIVSKKLFKLVLIDHHSISDLHKIADLKIWHDNWSSTSQGLFYLFDKLNELTPQMVTWLYLALIADTGAFQYRVNPETFRVASRLLSQGADRFWATNFFENHKVSINRLRLFGEISQRAVLISEWNLLLAVLDSKSFDGDATLAEEDLTGLVGFLQNQNLAKVVILIIKQKNGQIRGFIRSKDKSRPAGQIAKLFGGSGFDRAGGFIIRKTFATLN